MSQEERQQVLVSVVALRAESYSADNGNIVISLRTKYSTAERKYSVPIECFRDLIVDLQRLSAFPSDEPGHKATSATEPLLPLELPGAAE